MLNSNTKTELGRRYTNQINVSPCEPWKILLKFGKFSSVCSFSYKRTFSIPELVDVAGAGQFSFDLWPQSAQLHVLTVHKETAFNQSPSFAELLLTVALQCSAQEAVSQTWLPQTSFHALNSLVPVELQGMGEVLNSGVLSGTQYRAATSPAQVFCPDFRVVWAARLRSTVFLDNSVQVSYGLLM